MNQNDMPEAKELMKMSYNKHQLKYKIYEGLNRFHGTPIPEGYEAHYVNDGVTPGSLMLKKIGDK